MNWQNINCLLTGASGGIGQAIAFELASLGVNLTLTGRNEIKLKDMVQQLSLVSAGNHRYVVADIAQAEQREALIQKLKGSGGINMVINNAGVSSFGEFDQQKASDIQQQIELNLTIPMMLIHGLLPVLKQQPEAYIVNVGSTFGSIGFPCFTSYCASKFGLRGFTEALQRELADTKVKTLYFAPRTTTTSINSPTVVAMNQALGNHSDTPEQVARKLVNQLQSARAREFVGWPEKLFVRVNGFLPKLVDNALMKKLPVIKKFANLTTVENQS
ncbi:SDR family oxidoreductase [Paraneptunicella aestuarii]|uniref:SDR family oxidoreductase n=1 Tax=Paraneptunicella aestuarii TaxID=2831148 RepID=UPI001E3E868E|nr:SDR family oxidoreductase [Paraneptunicella aestuarii]UAA40629.1 SDR family oxidoreductase [Paraneptunicella aestuarii]